MLQSGSQTIHYQLTRKNITKRKPTIHSRLTTAFFILIRFQIMNLQYSVHRAKYIVFAKTRLAETPRAWPHIVTNLQLKVRHVPMPVELPNAGDQDLLPAAYCEML